MDFSIIVPVRNRPDAIQRCVASLYGVDYPPTQYEVLVVDNGSTDETARIAVESGARVLSESVPNRCLARNAGAKVARGRWLAFTDSDCEVDKDWLAELAKAEASLDSSGRVGVLAGMIVPGKSRSTVEAYIAERGWIDQEKFLAEGRRFSPPFAATANLAVRADVFADVGGFDPDLPPAEDADWCWRARAADWDIHFVPGAKVTHHHRSTLKDLLQQAYGYGLGNAALFAKHRHRWGARAWIDPRWTVWALKGLIKTPWLALTGSSPLGKRVGWYDFLSNAAQAAGRIRGGFKHRIVML